MASGLKKGPKSVSTKSLGSFVDIQSASSSDFEPVDLEDMESADEGELKSSGNSQQEILGKNATPAAGVSPALRTVPEQSEIRGETGSPAYQYAEPVQEGLQNLENATQKAAELAKDFTTKLLSNGAAEARSSVMKLAGDVSSWWAALDPGLPQPQENLQTSARSAQDGRELQDQFGLPEDEELMEKFPCKLLQTLECQHNSFSKPQQVQFSGNLYITDKNTCFSAEHVRFAIPHHDVKEISKGELGKALQLKFGESSHVLFSGFTVSDLNSALGLMEHLTSGA